MQYGVYVWNNLAKYAHILCGPNLEVRTASSWKSKTSGLCCWRDLWSSGCSGKFFFFFYGITLALWLVVDPSLYSKNVQCSFEKNGWVWRGDGTSVCWDDFLNHNACLWQIHFLLAFVVLAGVLFLFRHRNHSGYNTGTITVSGTVWKWNCRTVSSMFPLVGDTFIIIHTVL